MDFSTAIGLHRAWRQGDLMGLCLTGPLTLADIEVLRDRLHRIRREHGGCYMVVDAAGLNGIAADARKALADWGRSAAEDQVSGIGVYGISFAMRALCVLTLSAIKLMSSRAVNLLFASDEAEARAWIARCRAVDGGADSTE